MSDRYEGPLEPGMVMTAPDDDGVLGYRRDLLVCPDPSREDMWIYEALPCRMRRRPGSGIGELGRIPEVNVRIVMRPEAPA